MLYDQNTTLTQFLDGTATRQPSPGGGSAAALAGALAAAVGEMVVNYSIGKKDLEGHQGELRSALAELHRGRSLLLELMIEDQNAYQALTAARKLPKDSPDRRQEYEAALLACIRVPQAIAATAAAVVELSDRLVDRVNPHLLSDLAVCADLAMAAVRCGLYNVRVNLPAVDDPSDRQRIEAPIGQVLSRAVQTIQRVVPRIWQRHERSK